MVFSGKKAKYVRWGVRGLVLLLLAFALPFYFGYGNPLPFLNPDYTAWDNLWLSVFPVMFFGLVCGLRFFKLGGYLVVGSVGAGILGGILLEGELVVHMLVPLAAGLLLLWCGYTCRD